MKSETNIEVRYAETDKMGIVHHSVYPIWYEMARTKWIKEELGITYSQMESMGVMTPLLELECKYKKPSYYEDKLIVKIQIAEITPVKIKFAYQVYNTQNSEIINTGFTLHAFVNHKMKVINLKKTFPEIYHKMLAFYEQSIIENKNTSCV